MKFLSSIFEDITLSSVGTAVFIILLAVMVLSAVAVNVVPKIVHKWEIEYKTRDITYGAVCLAMSYALSFATLFKMPQGGSVTPAALAPIFIYCYYFGFRKGSVVAAAYTLLQLLQTPYIISPWSAFFDYIFPYYSVCVVGLFCYRPQKYSEFVKRNKATDGAKGKLGYWLHTVGGHWGIFAGAAIHMVLRYLSSALSGILFFGEFAPEAYGPVAWGFLYNSFLLVDSAIALVATVMLMSSRSFNLYMSASFDDKKRLGGNSEPAPAETSVEAETVIVAEATAATDKSE